MIALTTIKDVAKKANVSIATVSRVINEKGYVSEKTRKSIHQAIRELNYSPNQLARNLYSAETKAIGYIIPNVCHPFFSEVTQLIEKKLYDAGYHMLLCTTDRNADRESQIIDMLRQHRVDGIIVGSYTSNISAYSKAGIPVVAFDTLLECADVCVSSNHQVGGDMVADRVLKSGCRSVLQVIGNPDAKTDAINRHRIFFERMTLAGIPCVSVPITDHSDLDVFTYSHLAQNLLQAYPEVDTYFATDLIAVEIVKAALRRGYRVPEDIQVIGYDGSYIAAMSYPAVTTICQPIPELVNKVVTSICRLINGEPVEKNIILDNLFILEGATMR